MKKVLMIIWCGVTSFVTPIWLMLTVWNLSGLIYKYDYSMDEGTAGIIGGVLLLSWICIVLLPNIIFAKKIKDKRLLIIIGCCLAAGSLLCTSGVLF